MKLIFAVLYVPLNDGPYTLLQNDRFFYIYTTISHDLINHGIERWRPRLTSDVKCCGGYTEQLFRSV